MSVIAAKVYQDKIVIAADSILVRGWSKKSNRKNDFQKIAQINGMIIGGVGTAEANSLMFLFAETHKPARADERGIAEYFAEFAKWAKGYADVNTIENDYLIAYSSKLFSVEGFFVAEVGNYEAIGAGEDFANTALYLGLTPERAVSVACEMCCMVSGPVVQYEMKI